MFDKSLLNDQDREAILKLLHALEAWRIRETRKLIPKAIMKTYRIPFDNDFNLVRLHQTGAKIINVELVEETVLVEASKEEFESTSLQPRDFQGHCEPSSTIYNSESQDGPVLFLFSTMSFQPVPTKLAVAEPAAGEFASFIPDIPIAFTLKTVDFSIILQFHTCYSELIQIGNIQDIESSMT